MVEGLETKPYLLGDVMQVEITSCVISSYLVEIWIKSCLIDK
jgi:hypothetical protein